MRALLLATLSLTISVVSADAFGQPQPQSRPAAGSRWEIEVHGGGGITSTSSEGTGALPPQGQTFITPSLLPSRRVPTWYFGDGAQLLNQVNQGLGYPAAQIHPLDTALQSAAAEWGSGASLGARVSYAFTPKVALEFNVDAPFGHRNLTSSFLDNVEATRASYISAWSTSSASFTKTATSTSNITDGQGRQTFITAAVRITLAERKSLAPYVTAGAGIVWAASDGPVVALDGNYQVASTTSPIVLSEADHVRITVIPRNTAGFAAMFGGGVRIQRWTRSGFRLDARAYVSQSAADVVADTTPVSATNVPPSAYFTLTPPTAIQISSVLAGDLPSSLGSPGLAHFTTFRGSGTSVHLSLSAGYFVRF